MDKYARAMILIASIWLAIGGSVYYAMDPIENALSYMTNWLASATGFLIYIAYKPRRNK